MPYYPRPYDQGVPVAAFEALAQVHAWYLNRGGELRGLEPTDRKYWRHHCLQLVLPHVEQVLQAGRHPILERAQGFLHQIADDERFFHALAVLPGTLVHGDMHPANVLVTPLTKDEKGVVQSQQHGEVRNEPLALRPLEVTIIDWGNARIGPTMLDLANITRPGDAGIRELPADLAALHRCRRQSMANGGRLPMGNGLRQRTLHGLWGG